MLLLFPSNPLHPSKVDSEFEPEYDAALEQFECGIFDLDGAEAGEYKKAFKRLEARGLQGLAIYRGWMLRAEKYEAIYNALKDIGITLINDPTQYKFCHHLPENYSVIEPWTAKTVVIPDGAIQPIDGIMNMLSEFGNKPLILKDYVKSEKTHWNDACFIKDASDPVEVQRITDNFLKYRGAAYTGGLVYREFLDLNFNGTDLRGQPLTEEYRLWVIRQTCQSEGRVFTITQYAKSALNLNPDLYWECLGPMIEQVNSNFFSIDVAFTKEGKMKVIELGDGGVGGLPLHYDANIYYRALKAAIGV